MAELWFSVMDRSSAGKMPTAVLLPVSHSVKAGAQGGGLSAPRDFSVLGYVSQAHRFLLLYRKLSFKLVNVAPEDFSRWLPHRGGELSSHQAPRPGYHLPLIRVSATG